VHERDDLDQFKVLVHEVPELKREDLKVHPPSTRHQDCRQERVRDDATDGPIDLPLEALDLFRGSTAYQSRARSMSCSAAARTWTG
jgi:hypothetical protein